MHAGGQGFESPHLHQFPAIPRPGGTLTTPAQNPRYEVDEKPPLRTTLGYGFQFSMIASATLLITPVIVAQAAGGDDAYLKWMVFASLLVVGVSTLLQVRKLGPLGGGAVLPMFTAAFSIPFCIAALVDGGPATLTTLILVSALAQLAISRWLFILRRIVTPVVGGTVMMILSITLSSVIFGLLNEASETAPGRALLTTTATLVIVAALALRGSPILRLWAPVIGIVGGCLVAAPLGLYDVRPVLDAPWVGLPPSWPGLGLDFSLNFWVLVPSFLFLGVIISIEGNGEAIAQQRVAWRDNRAVDFRQVQGALAGGGVSNLLAGIVGAVPNIIHPGIVAFSRATGLAARRMGYCIGIIFILIAFLPKVSGLLSTIPGPVMTGYLMMVVGSLFVDGARTVIQSEQDGQKLMVAGVCFWIGAPFQFGLFHLPDLGPVVNALLKSAITTGGVAAVAMILYLELTKPRSMRFQSRLDIESLPALNEFVRRFADRRGWNDAMKDRLSAVAEETLLTLAPLDLEGLMADDEEEDGEAAEERRLVVLASSDGTVADLEFIGGGGGDNIEDQVRQLQQFDTEAAIEEELSLVLLRSFASSVRHQQYHGTDVITVRVAPPG